VPNSGATTSQTNYLKVTLNTGQMTPGYYADDIVFDTNGGEGIVEVFEILSRVVYEELGGDPFFFNTVDEFHSFHNISQALRTM
jgi:hypothetical protein